MCVSSTTVRDKVMVVSPEFLCFFMLLLILLAPFIEPDPSSRELQPPNDVKCVFMLACRCAAGAAAALQGLGASPWLGRDTAARTPGPVCAASSEEPQSMVTAQCVTGSGRGNKAEEETSLRSACTILQL